MRAVILAAGRGSRMGPHTADRPKALCELLGRSLLDRQLGALRAAGARDVAVVAGWHAELFDDTGLTVFRNERWAETTQVESLLTADPWLREGPVLVSYGDIVYSAETVRALAGSPRDIALAYDPGWQALWERRFAAPLEDAETFRLGEADLVAEIGGRPESVAEVQGQYVGLLRFTPPGWALFRETALTEAAVRGADLTGLLRFLVRERGAAVGATPVSGPWCEFDQPSDIEAGLDVLAELDRRERG
jgi:choline kinase